MAISTQDYVKKPNETIEQYNTRVASLRGDTPAELATMNTLSATSVGSNPTINAGIINAPTPQSVTNSVANILSSAAGTPQYVQGLQQQQADLLKMYQDQSQSILAKMQETTNQPNVSITDELKKLQEQYGIPDYLDKISALAPEITAIQEKINAINQREAQAIENLRGKAISEFTAQGQEAALKRQAAIERSGYAAELGVKQAMVESYKGNITQARSLISDAVQAYTFDIQQKNDDMDRMYKFYGDFIGQLDKNTQNQLSIVRDELATERERQIKDANTIGEMMLKYPNSGIKFSDTVQQAIIKAQPEAASQALKNQIATGSIEEIYAPNIPGLTKTQSRDIYSSPTPPTWFRQKEESKSQATISPIELQRRWDNFVSQNKKEPSSSALDFNNL
jgi:molybdopterin-biosynthesis enzyme MoeA-like protein